MFLNSYLGYTMWDYESDAAFMWPEKQGYPTAAQVREVLDRNPEGAAPRGKWALPDFLGKVADHNSELKDTQFADYHGHGWNFRASTSAIERATCSTPKGIPSRRMIRRNGGEPVRAEFVQPGVNPGKAVQLMDIHAEKGMQWRRLPLRSGCSRQWLDHGRGGQCGGDRLQGLPRFGGRLSNPENFGTAAGPQGTDLTLLRNPDGQRRFEWVRQGDCPVLMQRSIIDPAREWRVSLVRNSVNPACQEVVDGRNRL